jgi:hypothetical protein
MRYAVWEPDHQDPEFAWITSRVIGAIAENEHELSDGKPCRSWFPPKLVVPLEPGTGAKLPNAVPNFCGWIVADADLRAVIEAHVKPGSIEFLPLRVRRGKKTHSRPFWMANVLTTVEAVDLKRSRFTKNALRKGRVADFTKLVLDERRIPADAALFRLSVKPNTILVREDLGRAIKRAVPPLTGMWFCRLADYGAEFRPSDP